MLVVVPTYKRIDQLRWSLKSVIRADKPLNEECRLCVVSNHPDSHNEVENTLNRVLAEETDSKCWSIDFIPRRKTVPAVENWYSAICSQAKDGEVVFLHGDDDLMMPWGLSFRNRELLDRTADAMITRFYSGLVFINEIKCIPPEHIEKSHNSETTELNLSSVQLNHSPFIGNNAYRMGNKFKKSLDKLYQLCMKQDWIDIDYSRLMTPFYLPIVILTEGGKVIANEICCEARGTGLAEIVHSPHGCSNWNDAFMYGSVLDMLNSESLSKHNSLNDIRKIYKDLSAIGVFTVMLDKRIPSTIRKNWFSHIWPQLKGSRKKSIIGVKNYISDRSGLRAYKAKLKHHSAKTVDTEEWLTTIDTLKF